MTETIYTACLASAEKLAETIKAGSSYADFQQQIDVLRSDEAALTILQEFQNEQQALRHAQQYGDVSQDAIRNLQEKEQEMQNNEILAAFFAAQQRFVDQLAEINASLSAHLGFDFSSMAKPAGGCGCGGSC